MLNNIKGGDWSNVEVSLQNRVLLDNVSGAPTKLYKVLSYFCAATSIVCSAARIHNSSGALMILAIAFLLGVGLCLVFDDFVKTQFELGQRLYPRKRRPAQPHVRPHTGDLS